MEGKIISRFGRIRDKHFGTKIINNGLDLKVRKGSEVRAIFHGKVLFADSLEGYGNLLILGHGDNYHSLYGHLDQFKVEKGARVMEGQIIGLSGDSGSLRGETLYLEIRHNGKPINPIEWLQTAKRKLN
ncbi:MAG: peptidoglycan DD-metalloendopeptidase family protein [Nitrospinaceae bacterium]|nr:peptidoglycan DD-metalloendopeptidase family protein [Nitrospinaceae bacterium]